MGVVFALGFLVFFVIIIVVLIIGIILISLGLTGTITTSVLKRKGKQIKKPIRVLSITSLISGIVILIPIVALFTYCFVSYLTPPADYVETPLVIEENGRQEYEFTVEGVKYKRIRLLYNFEIDTKVAVFSWKTKGWINSGLVGNYYEFKNNSIFYFVMDEDNNLFCKESEYDEIIEYYEDLNNFNTTLKVCHYLTGETKPIVVNEVIDELNKNTGNKIGQITISNVDEIKDNKYEVVFSLLSKDNFVEKYFYYDVIKTDDYYYLTNRSYNEETTKITYDLEEIPSKIYDLIVAQIN